MGDAIVLGSVADRACGKVVSRVLCKGCYRVARQAGEISMLEGKCGSRLAGPTERKEKRDRASKMIAGVQVPPKPEEPDNCCMSGCVNCVWDVYGEELEEWAQATAEAKAKIRAQQTEKKLKGQGTGSMVAAEGTPAHVASSMDDDGGGSETNWSIDLEELGGLDDAQPEKPTDEELWKNIPVGIREFMKTEKRLKEQHAHEEAQV